MGKLIYSMMASLDSFIEGPDGELDWHVIDEELHSHFNDLESTIEMHLYGRRLYEIMAQYWPTADQNPTAPAFVVEYARIWREKPKIVYSKTLDQAQWNSRLVREVIPHEINKLKEQSGKSLSLGGPNLATTFRRLGLIDEYWVYVNPVVVGKGKPMFSDMDGVARLQLVETRPFRSGVMLLRYQPADELESNLPAGLSKPAQQALAVAGYSRLEQLTLVSEKEILKLHGMGPKTVRQLRQALATQGLSFAKKEKK